MDRAGYVHFSGGAIFIPPGPTATKEARATRVTPSAASDTPGEATATSREIIVDEGSDKRLHSGFLPDGTLTRS